MLKCSELIDIVTQINSDIENSIDNLSTIEPLVIETDGTTINIKLFEDVCWTNEDGEINTKDDLEQNLLDMLKAHKTQVDGMIGMWEKKDKAIEDEDIENYDFNTGNVQGLTFMEVLKRYPSARLELIKLIPEIEETVLEKVINEQLGGKA